MPSNQRKNRPHFFLKKNGKTERFSSPNGGGGDGVIVPDRDRETHGNALLSKLQQIAPTFAEAVKQQHQAGLDEDVGLQIEFESFPDIELAFESLARERSGIELRNVRHDGNRVYATVFVPDGKLDFFEKLITAYLDEDKDTKNGPKNRKLDQRGHLNENLRF